MELRRPYPGHFLACSLQAEGFDLGIPAFEQVAVRSPAIDTSLKDERLGEAQALTLGSGPDGTDSVVGENDERRAAHCEEVLMLQRELSGWDGDRP